jgi:hypothetical protein
MSTFYDICFITLVLEALNCEQWLLINKYIFCIYIYVIVDLLC